MKRLTRMVLPVLGTILLICGWQLLAQTVSPLVVAAPGATARALFRLLGNSHFLVNHLMPTMQRIGTALLLGIGIGTAMGILAGLIEPLRLLLVPVRWVLMSVPGVIVVVIFMLWLGTGTPMVVSITAAMAIPVIYVNVADGMAGVDRTLLEMARVYKMPLCMRLTRIYAMALAGPLLSGAVIATGNSIRLVVLAEMLGATQGLGHMLAISRANLQTDELYGLTLLAMLIIGSVELLLVRPARMALERRRS